MQCPRCHFENIPGLNNCARCSSVLILTAKLEVNPPRAGLGKFVRPVVYAWRRFWEKLPLTGSNDSILAQIFGNQPGWIDLCATLFSIVPGLGHFLAKRRHGIPATLGWLACIALGLYAYDSYFGSGLLGAAMALHAWMMIDAGDLRRTVDHAGLRFAWIIGVCLLLATGPYNYIRVHAAPMLTGYYAASDFPAHDIRKHDYLIVRSDAYAHYDLRRGDIVLTMRAQRSNGGDGHAETRVVTAGGRLALEQVQALSGDTVRLHLGAGTVTTPAGESFSFTPPASVATLDTTFVIENDQFFSLGVWSHAEFRGAGMATPQEILKLTGFAFRSEIKGRAIALYAFPARHRWIDPRDGESVAWFIKDFFARILHHLTPHKSR